MPERVSPPARWPRADAEFKNGCRIVLAISTNEAPSKDEAQRFLSQYGLKGLDIVSLLDPKA
jgi:hypothetical protein